MAGKDIIQMSLKEFKRLKVIQEVIEKRINQREAALMISLSERQVRRLVRTIRKYGEKGITHKSRGRPSPRKIPDKLKENVIRLYTHKYHDFGPTLASEKLSEIDNIRISDETPRQVAYRSFPLEEALIRDLATGNGENERTISGR